MQGKGQLYTGCTRPAHGVQWHPNLALEELSPSCRFLQELGRELVPRMPLFIFPLCFLRPTPIAMQDQGSVGPRTCHPGPVLASRKLGWSLAIDNVPCGGAALPGGQRSCCFYTWWKGWCPLEFADDWVWGARANSILVWVYFTLDELLSFVWQKPREYHRSNTHIFEKFLSRSRTSSWMKKSWLTPKSRPCCSPFW